MPRFQIEIGGRRVYNTTSWRKNMVEKDKGLAGAIGKIVKVGVFLVAGKKEAPKVISKLKPVDQLKARAEATTGPTASGKKIVVAEAKPAPVTEAPITPQAIRLRVREAAVEEFKTDYNKLSLGDKLKLLIEEAQKNPGENAATLTENLAALQKLHWERPSRDQLKKIESVFAQLPKDTRLELRERSVLVEARRVISLHLTDKHNAFMYQIKAEDSQKMANIFNIQEVRGGVGRRGPAGGGGVSGAGVEFPQPSANDKVNKVYERVRRVVGNKVESTHAARLAEHEINTALAKTQKDGNPLFTETEAGELRNFRGELFSYEAEMAGLEERHSSMYIDTGEAEAMKGNAHLFFEIYSRTIEEELFEFGYESDVLKNKLRRFDLLVEWYTSDSYDQIVGGEGLSIPVMFESKDKKLFQEIYANRQKFNKKKSELLNTYVVRTRVHDLLFALNNADDFAKDPRIMQLSLTLGDRGMFSARAQYGEIADLMYQKIASHHKALLNDVQAGVERRTTSEIFHEALVRSAKDLHAERALHQDTYTKHLNKLMDELEPVLGKQSVDKMREDIWKIADLSNESTCQVIANFSGALYTLMYEKHDNMVTYSAEPTLAAMRGQITEFGGHGWEDRFAFATRPRDMFFRKWKNWTNHMRAIWHGRALMYIEKDERLAEFANERTNALWKKITMYRKHWKDLGAAGNLPGRQGRGDYFDDAKRWLMMEQNPFNGKSDEQKAYLQEYLDFVELRGIFSDYHHKQIMGTSDSEAAHFFTTIEKDHKFWKFWQDRRENLHYYVNVDAGGDFAQRDAINFYGFWNSGLRRGAILQALKMSGAYKHMFEPGFISPLGENENGLMVGGRILGAAETHFNPKVHHLTEQDTKNFLEEVRIGAMTHPHELLRTRYNVESLYAPETFKMTSEQAAQLAQCSRMHGIIQHQLNMLRETPINYAVPYENWTNVQKQAFDKIYILLGDSVPVAKDTYLELMNGYAREVTEHINDFAHIKYAKRFSTIPWTDDVPLTQVELPQLIAVFEKDAEAEQKRLEAAVAGDTRLSHQISERGRGRTGLWVSGMYDLRVCIGEQLGLLVNTLSPDEKVATESLIQMDEKFFQYNSETDAAVSTIGGIAGFAEAARTRTMRFFKFLPFSSDIKQSTSRHGLSWVVDETHAFFDNIQRVRGSLAQRAPLCMEAAEKQAGITDWRSFFEPKFYGRKFRWLRVNDHKFNEIVELLNSYVPSGLYWFGFQNALMYAGLGGLILGISQSTEEQKGGSHH